MNKENIKDILSKLFVPRAEGLEGVAFRSEYMKSDSDAYEIYNIVSDAQRSSGLSFDFSYKIASIAVEILSSAADWEDEDSMRQAIDYSVPIWTSELMEIFKQDSWAVDDARKEYGPGQDTTRDAQMAWYFQIEQMAAIIKNGLDELTK